MVRQHLTRILSLAALALALAIVLPGCGGDDDPPTGPGGGGGAADVTINILGNSGSSSYSPNPDTVSVGQTVAWHNSDSMTHTATGDGGEFNTGNIGAGSTSAKITMSTAGSIPYHCAIHSGMVATLVVKP